MRSVFKMEVMTTKVDDVIGTTAHAVSAVLLLLAIVIWSTLKVLGHTLTQRYLTFMYMILLRSIAIQNFKYVCYVLCYDVLLFS